MYLIIIVLVTMLAGQTDKAAAGLLTVMEFSQPPNYSLCKDDNDSRQLTDGELATFPI